MGMSSCKKRVGTLLESTPKMRKQLRRFLPTFSGVGGKVPCGGIGKVGSNDMGNLLGFLDVG